MTTDLYEAQRPIIDALRTPAAYPPDAGVNTIEVRETHSAIVFLAGAGAYKMKKAVNFGFLDFSTLRQRRFFCYQELFLNQRAAPDVYREVLSIVPDGAGSYRISDEFDLKAVEYLVQMVRLPEDMMLGARLDRPLHRPHNLAGNLRRRLPLRPPLHASPRDPLPLPLPTRLCPR